MERAAWGAASTTSVSPKSRLLLRNKPLLLASYAGGRQGPPGQRLRRNPPKCSLWRAALFEGLDGELQDAVERSCLAVLSPALLDQVLDGALRVDVPAGS